MAIEHPRDVEPDVAEILISPEAMLELALMGKENITHTFENYFIGKPKDNFYFKGGYHKDLHHSSIAPLIQILTKNLDPHKFFILRYRQHPKTPVDFYGNRDLAKIPATTYLGINQNAPHNFLL